MITNQMVPAPTQTIQINDESDLDRVFLGDEMSVEGVDLLGREDLAIPRLTLVQAQTNIPNAARHAGEWHNSLTGEFKQSVNAVLLALSLGRVAFDRTYNKESEPLCGSDDAIEPRPDFIGTTVTDSELGIEVVIPELCALCPLSKFGDNGKAPLCAKTYIYFMLDIDSGLPVILQMQRTGTKTARNINTVARMLGRRKLVSLSSKEVPSNSGTYYEPVYTAGEATPADILQQCRQITLEFGNMARRLQRENRVVVNEGIGTSGPDGDAGEVPEPNLEDLPF